MALKFVEAPPRSKHTAGGGGSKYAGILVELIQNPGKWALILEYKGTASAYSMPRRLRTYPGWGKENVEFAARKDPGGKGSSLYARYVGPTLPVSLTGIEDTEDTEGNGSVALEVQTSFEELGPNQI